jgi:capsular exopolysaccharide synthesis family protein
MVKLRKSKADDHAPVSKINEFKVVEAYKELRTNLQFALSTEDSACCVFSSAEPNAGKSCTVANLAITLAAAERHVLVVDADLRKPCQHKLFNSENRVGLSNILAGKANAIEATLCGVRKNVDLVPSGPIPPNPSELLGHQRMDAFLHTMETFYDYVLVDCSPVMVVSDALELAPYTAGAVLVARQHKTRVDSLAAAAARFRAIDVKVLGVVLTDARKHGSGYYTDVEYYR